MRSAINYFTHNKKALFLGVLIMVAAVMLLVWRPQHIERSASITAQSSKKSQIELVSQVFRDGGNIPPQYTCQGQGVNPPLNISGIPSNAKSMALIMHDPDAPGGDYTHWVLFDIPATTKVIAANSVPMGALQGLNSNGKASYMGPCPPSGTHHYVFDLYALDNTLGLTGGASRSQVESAMKGHIIDRTTLVGLFSVN